MDSSPQVLIALGFIWYVTFLFSTTCHEASHALAAKIGGDETAALGGQVSLNPIPHIRREPFGMVGAPLLSYILFHSMIGWASAPFDPLWERRHPKRSAWMALAGPTANFTLMLIAVIGLRLGIDHQWIGFNPATGQADFPMQVLWTFFRLNLLLGTFNLLPAPPLDGSTVIMLFMSEKTAHKYLDWLRENSYAMAGIILAMLLFRRIYPLVLSFATEHLLKGYV